MKSIAYLEALFQHLKKSFSKRKAILNYTLIELSYAEKTDNRYWSQPKLKKLVAKYNVMFGYIDTVTETIHFLVNV